MKGYEIFQYDKWTPDLNPVPSPTFNSKEEANDYIWENHFRDIGDGKQFLLIEFLPDNTSKIVEIYGIK